MSVSRLLMLAACLGAMTTPAFAACETFSTYQGVALKRFAGSSAYTYQTGRMAIDADGAPNAYHPDDTGIDALANAGYPDGGWTSVLVVDPDRPGRPYVQKTGAFAGYYLSKTTLQDRTKAVTDRARYVDPREVPYVVFPGNFYALAGTGRKGVIGMARNLKTSETSPMIFADVGPSKAGLGEVSIKLAENLGGSSVNPRTGAGMPKGPFAYVIFPGSETAPAWPLTADQLKAIADAELAKVGGWEAVTACLK